MSPELCNKIEYIGPKVDVWAIGVVMYTLIFGNQPWRGKSEQELFRKITQGVLFWPKSSHSDFIKPKHHRLQSANNLVGESCQSEMNSKYSNQINNGLASERNNESKQDDPYSNVINYSKQAKMIVKDLLILDPKLRPSSEEILSKYHYWFKSFD